MYKLLGNTKVTLENSDHNLRTIIDGNMVGVDSGVPGEDSSVTIYLTITTKSQIIIEDIIKGKKNG